MINFLLEWIWILAWKNITEQESGGDINLSFFSLEPCFSTLFPPINFFRLVLWGIIGVTWPFETRGVGECSREH